MYDKATDIQRAINDSKHLLVIQADNPDADSLGSALALEHLLGDMGKEVSLFCAVDMPAYLRYMPGWDRVNFELPRDFDTSLIVDASTLTLFEKLQKSGDINRLKTKPCLVLDHHETVENPIDFAGVVINDHTRASTGELIYMIAKQLDWVVSVEAMELIMNSILGDTQGLSNQLASSETYRIMAEFIDAGVNRGRLEEQRRELSKMPVEIFRYKADLIKRSEFSAEGRVACVVVPQTEINKYSPLYNPGPLIQNDLLQTLGVEVAIVLKTYDDGRITGAIRCNSSSGIAAELAEHFGGGGHAFASGFKVTGGAKIDDLKQQCISQASSLLDKVKQ